MGFLRRVFGKQSADGASVSDDARYERDLVRRMIAEGRDPDTDPEFRRYICLKDPRPIGDDRSGNPKYRLAEMPGYLGGRKEMAERGANLYRLDSVILNLRYGYMPPRGCRPHKLHGSMEGMMECHIGGRGSDWVLMYSYDEDELCLYALDTGAHADRETC